MKPEKNDRQASTLLPPVMKLEQVAKDLQVSTRHIRRKIKEGAFPRPFGVGKAMRFLVADILAYIEGQREQGAH